MICIKCILYYGKLNNLHFHWNLFLVLSWSYNPNIPRLKDVLHIHWCDLYGTKNFFRNEAFWNKKLHTVHLKTWRCEAKKLIRVSRRCFMKILDDLNVCNSAIDITHALVTIQPPMYDDTSLLPHSACGGGGEIKRPSRASLVWDPWLQRVNHLKDYNWRESIRFETISPGWNIWFLLWSWSRLSSY